MKKVTRPLLLFLLFACNLTAQHTISGKVTESDGITPISEVHVLLRSGHRSAFTSGDGTFEFSGVPLGTHILEFSSLGYRTQQDTVSGGDLKEFMSVVMIEVVHILPEATIDGGTITGGVRHLQDIPGSAFYLGPKELEKFEYVDVHRVLGEVPGLHMQEEDGYGLRPNIGMRGSGSERSSKITLMEDGILAAPAPYAAPSAYYFPSAGRMHGIEILKGSSQIKYGPNTTGGAINFISTPIPSTFGGSISMIGGLYDAHNVHAVLGNTHPNVAYMAEVFEYGTDGFKELEGYSTGFEKTDYLFKLRLNTNPRSPVYQAVSVKAGRMKELSNETYLGLTEEDFRNRPYMRYLSSQRDEMDARQEQYSIRHSLLLPGGLSLQTTAYRQDFSRNWYKLDKIHSEDQTIGISGILSAPQEAFRHLEVVRGVNTTGAEELQVKANNRVYRSEGVQSVLRFSLFSDQIEHRLEAGVRLHRDHMDRYQWVDTYTMQDEVMRLLEAGIPGTGSNRIERARAFAGFVQYHVALGDIRIYPGLRYEHVGLTRMDYGKSDPERTGVDLQQRENTFSAWLPGIGVTYALSPRHSVFAGVHKGFAPAGSNAGARPERSVNYELGWRHRDGSISLEAVLFYSYYRNLLGADIAAVGGSGSTDTYNGGAAETGGLEVLAALDILKGTRWHVPLQFSYTYTFGHFRNSFESSFSGWGNVTSGSAIPYLAPHRMSLQAGIIHKRYRINLSMRYTDKMPTTAGSDITILYTDNYLVMDLAAAYTIASGFEVFVTVRNVTDAVDIVARRPAGVRPQMPRTAEFGLRASF